MKREIVAAGYDCTALAEKWGVDRAKMSYYVYRLGLHMRPKLRYHTDTDLLIAAAECKSAAEFQRKHGISRGKLKDEFEKRGLPWPFGKERTLRGLDPDVAERMYREAGYNWKDVAKKLGVTVSTMMIYRREHGIESHRGTTKYPWTYKLLHYLYVECGFGARISSRILRKHWGTDGPTDVTFLHALRRFGIETRTHEKNCATEDGWFGGKYPVKRDEHGRVMEQPTPDIPSHVLDELTDEAWLAEPEGDK